MKTTVQVLKEARELISDPAKWTQQAMARDKKGAALPDGHSDGAVCWCIDGAIEYVSGTSFGPDETLATKAIFLVDQALGQHAETFNDRSTHSQVLEAIDKAIALAESEAA